MTAATMTAPASLEKVQSAINFVCPDDRETWVRVAMSLKSEFAEDGEWLWHDWSKSGSSYHEADAKAVWRSVKAGGKIGIGTLFHLAKEQGWSWNRPERRLSATEIAAMREASRLKVEEAEAEKVRVNATAAQRAEAIWGTAEPASNDHPYLERKGVLAHGIRVGAWDVVDPETGEVRRVSSGVLLVPIKDRTGRLWSLQAILPVKLSNGKDKLYLAGGAKVGHFHAIGKPAEHNGKKVFVLCEGYATGASIHEATGHLVLVCFDTSGLLPVAAAIRERQPNAIIILAADNDLWTRRKDGTPYNPGIEAATKAAAEVGALLAVPPFTADDAGADGTGPTDFNDLAGLHGSSAVLAEIQKALNAGRVVVKQPDPEPPVDEATPPWEGEPTDFNGLVCLEGAGALAVQIAAALAGAPVQAEAEGVNIQTQDLSTLVSVPPPTGVTKRRTIQIIPGELPEAVNQAEAALVEQCNDIFQRAGIIVRPVRALIDVADGQQVDGVRLSHVSKHHLAERLTGAANWEKYDARAGDYVPIDCPVKIAETYLARDGSWRLKALSGIIDAPTLRPDGSILNIEGFDEKTGLLLLGDQSAFKPIPENPTKGDAQEALRRLLGLIATFPFVGDQDRSVALSGVLTSCIRRSLPSAPMHCFSAPTAGSGKSMLVDLASIIACGRQAAVMSQGRDEAEQEKRLASALLAGDPVVSIDNATLPIDGDLLCQVLTQQSVRLRVLGVSVLRTMPTNAAFFVTGNSLLIQGDMTRRALLCTLDPECERPEQRIFSANPKDVAENDRASLLCDVLTILRAFHVAGRPQPTGIVPLGSFEVWSQWVRGALLWLEQEDPVQTMEKARASDPKLEAIVAVMSQWREVVGMVDVSVKDAISKATEPKLRPDADIFSYRQAPLVRHEFLHDDLREALLAVAGTGGAINSRALGKWLAANKGRLIALPGKDGQTLGSFRFIQTTTRHGVAIWRLEEVKRPA